MKLRPGPLPRASPLALRPRSNVGVMLIKTTLESTLNKRPGEPPPRPRASRLALCVSQPASLPAFKSWRLPYSIHRHAKAQSAQRERSQKEGKRGEPQPEAKSAGRCVGTASCVPGSRCVFAYRYISLALPFADIASPRPSAR